jgi:hypothetical protein
VHLASGAPHEWDEPPEVRVQHGRHLVRVAAPGEAREARRDRRRGCSRPSARAGLVEVEGAETLLMPPARATGR